MGKEFVVNSLEELCDLMCNNRLPEQGIREICENCKYDRKDPKKGHWINMEISINGDMSAECDKCGCIVRNSFTNNAINYCPNCGVRMESEE